jgi:hypothetical protein
VNIKVDREERPDVDNVYMTFVQATTGGGGWPMSVWLTPDLRPSRAERIPAGRRLRASGISLSAQADRRSLGEGRKTNPQSGGPDN